MDRSGQEASVIGPGAPRWPLALIVVGFLLLGVYYILHTPPFEGPDEGQHFAYIRWLVEEGTLPPQGEAAWDTPVEQEAGQPPLFYLLASLPARFLDLDNPEATYRVNPYFPGPFPRDYPDNDNRAIHYPGEVTPAGGWLALYLARAVSLAFGALLVVATFCLVRAVLPEQPRLAYLTALFVAVLPQVLFLSAVASNDIPVAALSTVTLWAFAILVRRGPHWRRALLVGVAFGFAVLAKVNAMTLVVPLGLGLAWLWLSGRQTLRSVVQAGLWLSLGALLVTGWWFGRNWLLYGSPLGLGSHDLAPWALSPGDERLVGWRGRWGEVFNSLWLWFGWGTIRAPSWVYDVLALLTLLAAVGLGVGLVRWWRRKPRRFGVTQALLLVLAAALLAAIPFLELWMRRVVAPYGRLLYTALAAILVFLVLGWRAWHPKLPWLPVTFLLIIGLLAPTAVLDPAFALPEPLTAAEVEALEPSQTLLFGPSPDEAFAELVSFELLEQSVVEEGLVPLRICWRTLAATPNDVAVLVHIIGPDNWLVANRRTHPGQGHYPTSVWEADQVFCDRVNVSTPEDTLSAPRVFYVELAMLDVETGQRVPMFNERGEPVETAFLERVRLVPGGGPPTAEIADGGAPVELAGAEVPQRTWQPGNGHNLTLSWVAAKPVDKDYQTFVHLRDPATGENVAQADGPPLDGWYPTSWWTEGELVVDERVFPLPADVAPGSYELVVGLYDLETGQRLGEEYDLGPIVVQS